MERLLAASRVFNSVCLVGIFVVAVLILRALPPPLPSEADITRATLRKDWKLREQIYSRIPVISVTGAVTLDEPVEVTGSVGVDGSVSIDGAVDVNVVDANLPGGTTIPVQIER
jgi:hypothetical protein